MKEADEKIDDHLEPLESAVCGSVARTSPEQLTKFWDLGGFKTEFFTDCMVYPDLPFIQILSESFRFFSLKFSEIQIN